MSNPLVSVIVPSYDRPLFLKTRSLPSVLRQDYQNWELIVVGDGPVDGSLREVTESFQDPRIRYVEIARPDYSWCSQQEYWHVAGAQARNHGLTLARGEFIAPLDDDDEFLPNHLSDAVDALQRGPHDFVYGCVLVRDFETGDEYEDLFPWEDEQTRELFLRRNIILHSSACYRRRYIDLRYAEGGHVPADYGLWLAIHDSGASFTSLSTPQSVYYGDNLSSSVRLSVPTLPSLDEFQESLKHIYKSKMLSNHGHFCRELEKRVAEYVDVPHAVSAPSGDASLMLAFGALRQQTAGRSQKVLMPSYGHPAMANAAIWNGFQPVFCDVDPATLCLSPRIVADALSDEFAAFVAVHAHGNPCDMVALEQLAAERGVFFITDAAAGFGASLAGRRIGSFASMEVFSFSGTKVLTAGEGGMVCCRDGKLAEVLRRLGRYGISEDYICDSPGINGKLAEIPAALALAGLPKVENGLRSRRMAVQRYRESLSGIGCFRFQEPVSNLAVSSCKDMALVTTSPAAARRLAERMRAYRVDTRPYYRPLHSMPAYAGCGRTDLSETERLADCVVCVPLYTDIQDHVQQLVCHVVWETLG